MTSRQVGSGLTKELTAKNKLPEYKTVIVVGTVIDTNDPLELGRVCVTCPELGDPDRDEIDDSNLPFWADCLMPFGGFTNNMQHGPEEKLSHGSLAYGFWGLPSVGSQVLVLCVGGNPGNRICLGSVLSHAYTTNTIPHGRFKSTGDKIAGPMSNTERAVSFLYDNLHNAFGNSYEFISRGADYTATAVTTNEAIENSDSSVLDDKDTTLTLPNGTQLTYTQGYITQRRNLDARSARDCTTYAWVTPGFHAISMDDRAENCRVRIRTTTGHQIILDDTNERILINTNGGKSYIEMDSNGNIDIHSDRHLSFHSKKDMSLTTDGHLRFRAQKGIHFLSDADIRMHAVADIHMRTTNLNLDAAAAVGMNAATTISLKSQTSLNLETTTLNLKAAGAFNASSGATFSIGAAATILMTAPKGYFNGAPATPASAAIIVPSKYAFTTNRVPFRINDQQQSWSRSMLSISKTDKDTSSNSINYYDYGNMEHPYESTNVGKVELGETIPRNPKWRR